MSVIDQEQTEETPEPPARQPGELGPVELLRWAWRQLTSMRTALILLLLVAVAAIPGSIVPQSGVDNLEVSQFTDEHPRLTAAFERLGLFSVYDSPWFAAIYLLLMLSLIGCILPRCAVYLRALRGVPPDAPRNFERLPEHAAAPTERDRDEVLSDAAAWLRARRYRVREGDGWVAAERGYLREAGNLVFHVSVLVVLVGFALGSLFGFQGGVILLQGNGFSNGLTQYDDFSPGPLFDPASMDPFTLTVTDFDLTWVEDGPAQGTARDFSAAVTYRESPTAPERAYDLRVNHPLAIGDTEVFLIGHGYAPVFTLRDGEGNLTTGPTVFLPSDPTTFRSFGVVKWPDSKPGQIALEGEFFPTYAFTDASGPFSVMGDLRNPAISMLAYTGDIGLDDGVPQSVYVLPKDGLRPLERPDGKPFRVDLAVGDSVELPEGLGTVTFEGVQRWQKLQLSRTPGKWLALGGVGAGLLGLCLSLYVRPRRTWLRVRETEQGRLVEVAGLDRTAAPQVHRTGPDGQGAGRTVVELPGGLAEDLRGLIAAVSGEVNSRTERDQKESS